jgi:hypothetical protein
MIFLAMKGASGELNPKRLQSTTPAAKKSSRQGKRCCQPAFEQMSYRHIAP